MRGLVIWVLAAMAALSLEGQVYSPKVLMRDQPDATDLHRLAQGIYKQAGANTPRERAEAVWRYFLTDGRFVRPGFWYHIAGWAYEEPLGEALDPLKLLNSYGFGLCYQIAPLLEAVWKAGGFEDARVWFLTGHTVAEVFYDGSYHHFDSDMMGYNTVGRDNAKQARVASVHDLEKDASILLGKLTGRRQVDAVRASEPWYPADVRAGAIPDLASAFTTTRDNRLFPFERAPQGHSMEFVLRPGERLIRFFRPEREGLFHLPYKWTGLGWEEFPREIAQHSIRTMDGPASQKDERRWATGKLEYRPPISKDASAVYEVRSPYVIIEAEFQIKLKLASAQQWVAVATSADDGRTWTAAGELRGPHEGAWRAEPAVLTRSLHGRRSHVSGTYGYLVKVTRSPGAGLEDLQLVTRIQVNPRSLPELKDGRNELTFAAGPPLVRHTFAVDPERAREIAHSVSNARFLTDGAQGYWLPDRPGAAEFVFQLADPSGKALAGFTAGGRFLDLSGGQAPEKFTAEVRPVPRVPATHAAASIAWSDAPTGPFQTIWEFDPKLKWKDGQPIDRTLLWPEVDRGVALSLQRVVYVRYRVRDMAVDAFRLGVETPTLGGSTPLEVRHVWKQQGTTKDFTITIPALTKESRYVIDTPKGARITNEAIIFESKRGSE